MKASASNSTPPALISELFALGGITFNGNQPWDIQVFDDEAYRKIIYQGSLGLGEAFVEGFWDSERLDETIERILTAGIENRTVGWAKLGLIREALRHRFFNLQTFSRAFEVAERHYDIGNDVFEAMLDSSMSYSCAYWANADNLEKAQQDKLNLICRKLELKPGERLLEIGCGWGGLAKYAALNFGVEVVGITISKEQKKLAEQRCAGLPVEIRLMDYRLLEGRFDKIVSVGMFEHVGPKNHAIYFQKAFELLRDDGLFLLHTIGNYKTSSHTDPWIDRYIFPNGKVPSAIEISTAIEQRFIIEDWHNFGQDYDRTLMAWWENFNRSWPQLQTSYEPQFYRMWKYYLMCCAGYFRSRQGQLWQLVLSKRDRRSIYRSMR
ncbi:MAG: cyclopropane fatty acyl phospholipid synthase [Nitrosomonadales bacterium]|nr:cyclopropane fatty acyl phospholipid synthase [Nitrosomonadales bacterium]